MKVTVGKHCGFCYGVKRAVELLEQNLGGNTVTLGEIIHNSDVVESFRRRGVKILDRPEDAEGGKVIIRSHGAPPEAFQALTARGAEIVDATCVFVRKIHKIVAEKHAAGYGVVIVGKRDHPEVVGINGWCGNSAQIVDSVEEARGIQPAEKLCVVVQTTYEDDAFQKILKNIPRDHSKTVEVFNTICYTTKERQREAERLAAESDAMIVVGGRHSSNTRRLAEICGLRCARVCLVENADELDLNELSRYENIGIVAGASTPQGLIKEVILRMEEKGAILNQEELVENQETAVAEMTMADVLESMDKTKFKRGQKVEATITNVTDDGLELSLPGMKTDKMLSKDEINYDGTYNKDDYQIGDPIEVKIVSTEPLTVSKRALIANELEEKEITDLVENKKEFTMTFKDSNKGGLIGRYGTYSVFVPASQIRLGYITDINKYKDKPLRLEITEFDKDKKKIVASQRVILEREKAVKEEERAKREEVFWDSIEEGQIVQGKVVRIAEFGAFVSVNGFDCLAHKSDLAWTPVASPSEIVEINKTYDFKVLKLDRESRKVSLGYKQLQPQPWDTVNERYAAGDTVHGRVARIVPFGAFVELEPGIDGLVHVSQVCYEWIEHPEQKLSVGQEIDARVLAVDPENQKITLSIKALEPEPERMERAERPRREFTPPTGDRAERAQRPRREPRSEGRRERSMDDDGPRNWTDSSSSGASIGDMLKALNMDFSDEASEPAAEAAEPAAEEKPAKKASKKKDAEAEE